MVLIITKDKIKKFLAAGNDIAIPILSLVKDTSGAFPPLQLAATGALFIATNVKVSSVSAHRLYKGIRENKENWDEFSRYVVEMVGETAL